MKFVFAILLGLWVAAPASAQANKPTRDLTGTIADPSGALVSAATITLFAPDNTEIAHTESNDAGNFTLGNVHSTFPGKFHLRVHREGFDDSILALDSHTPLPLKITLHLPSVQQSVSVDAGNTPQLSTEAADNQSANSVDRADLDHLPVFDMDYIGTLSRFLSDDATGTNGVSLVVNGMEVNGPGVSASAIKNVKINQNPYSALFARPGRARIEITTEEGTKDFHGSANFLFRDSVFDASNYFAASKPPERRFFAEGSLTGPIHHSKNNTFLFSGETDTDDLQSTVDAITPTGPIHQSVPTPEHHLFVSGRVFHDYSQGNQLWVSYSYEHSSTKNGGAGGTTLPEAATNQTEYEHEVNVAWTRVVSPHLLNQLHFLVGTNSNPVRSVTNAPAIVVQGAFTGGGAQTDYLRTESHFDGTDLVTFTRGRHELKFGIDVPDISRRGFDDTRLFGGSYSFASLAAYAAGQPATYTLQQGNGHVVFLEKVFALFVEDTLRLRPNLSLTGGVRYSFQNYFHDIPTNFAPRFSLAYAPGKKSGTVLRAGAGLFYDRTGPRAISDILHGDGLHISRFIDTAPTYPELPNRLAAQPPGLVQLDPRARLPALFQFSAGVERQLTPKSTFAANYIGTRGMDQFRSVDANAPLAPNFTDRPDPRYGQLRTIQSDGHLKINALELSFRGKPAPFFSGQAQYTLAKADNNTSGILYFPAYSYHPTADWARSDFDRRHKFDLLGTFKIGPTKPQEWFSFGTALALYSGKPVNVTTGSDNNGDGLSIDRPAGTPRNSLHGPGYAALDLNLTREFSFHKNKEEGRTLALSLNAFNVLNHPNYLTYVGVISSPLFDHPVEANPGRRMQLNLEWKF